MIAAIVLAAALGHHLYDLHCASCHGSNLAGSSQAPPLVNVDAAYVDFMLQTGRMPAQVPFEQEYHKRPAFTQGEIRSILAYVMSRSSGDKNLPVVAAEPATPALDTLRKGRELFGENCQQCHGVSAHGEASVGYHDVAPSLMDATPQEIAEAVREGPSIMPRFGPKVLSEQDLANVVTYVRFLRKAQYNPGGLQLANLGPVSEGFVLWAFGMILLVLLTYRIGSTD
jgi:ubiquinol-cytochrome c reductase cytochrome c subunit